MIFSLVVAAVLLVNVHSVVVPKKIHYKGDVTSLRTRIIDEERTLAESPFALKPDQLLGLTMKALESGLGQEDPSMLDEKFEFVAPVIGPLSKKAYLDALSNFDIFTAFPDLDGQYHFMRVDPLEPNRVWWHSRPVGTNTGPLLGKPATNIKVYCPPQASSVAFNENGKIIEFTTGYVVNRRIGNSGGLGAIFGFLYGVGRPLPFPECMPYKPSFRFKVFNKVGNFLQKLQKK